MRVSVCINTYRRPAGIAALLDDLVAQTGAPGVFEVIVVDNDAQQSGRDAVKQGSEGADFPVHYLVEPEQNISLARNRAAHAAQGDWIGMLDDDCRVAPDWLAQMAGQAVRSGADGVLSMLAQNRPDDLPAWFPPGPSVMGRKRFAPGAVMPANALFTGNLLIRKALLLSRDGPFDPAFGLSGGEDTDCLAWLHERGARFVWCDTAWAYEDMSADRLTQRWFLRRSRRGAQDYALHALSGRYGPVAPWSRVVWTVDAGFKLLVSVLGQGVAAAVPGQARARRSFAWRYKRAAQLGKLDVWLFGRGRVQEYRGEAQP